MRKKTCKNISELKGRSKIPVQMLNWAREIESKNENLSRLDFEHSNNTLTATYYTVEGGRWRRVCSSTSRFSNRDADNFFEYKELPKADFLIQMIEDQKKVTGMLNSIFEVNREEPTDEEEKAIRKGFENIEAELGPDESTKMEKKSPYSFVQMFKSDKDFIVQDTTAPDQEADFVGHDRILNIAKHQLEAAGAKYSRLIVQPSTPNWFMIEVIF